MSTQTKAEAKRVETHEEYERGRRDGHEAGYEMGLSEGYETCERNRAAEVDVILERWHNEVHRYVFRFCDESPCREVREAVGG